MTSEEGTYVERTSAQWKESLKGENEHLRKQIKLGNTSHCDEGQSKHMSQPNSKF